MENEHQITGKILVVDDLEENRMVLKSILEIHGYEIVEGVNGLEAVEKAQAENPDLILLDLNMPEMDGMTACRKIKKELKLDTIPVIFLTARREKDDLVKGFEAGAESDAKQSHSNACAPVGKTHQVCASRSHQSRQDPSCSGFSGFAGRESRQNLHVFGSGRFYSIQ